MVQAPSTSTVRLTDQALVAVHMGRSLAADRQANVGHLVAGIMGEPEGMAGRRLRRLCGGDPAVRLTTHAGLHAPGLPRLSMALIGLPVIGPPATTEHLLAATIRIGGAELAELLEVLSLDAALPPIDPQDVEVPDAPETFGRGTLYNRGFSDQADLAMARARGAGDDSDVLLPWLEPAPEDRAGLAALPRVPLQAVVERALATGQTPLTLSDLRSALVGTALEHLRLRQD